MLGIESGEGWSRNWDVDEFLDEPPQDNPPPQYKSEVSFSDHSGKPLSCKSLLVGTKGAGGAFLEACFTEKTHVGSIVLPDLENNETTCAVYTISNNDVVLVIVNYFIATDRTFDIVAKLFENIHPQQVFIFDSLVESSYQTTTSQKPLPPFVRKLQTSSCKHSDNTPFLEIPNMIEHFTAAILAYCEVRRIAACAYISLQEMRFINVQTISAYEAAFGTLNITPSNTQNRAELYVKAAANINKRADNGMYI